MRKNILLFLIGFSVLFQISIFACGTSNLLIMDYISSDWVGGEPPPIGNGECVELVLENGGTKYTFLDDVNSRLLLEQIYLCVHGGGTPQVRFHKDCSSGTWKISSWSCI